MNEATLIQRLQGHSRPELEAMYDAAAEVTDCERVLAKTGDSPVTEVLKDANSVEEWAHYPAGDVFDAATHGQYYYHAHNASDRVPGEHGHFHTFVRPDGLALDVQPAPLPDYEHSENATAHLVGISTNAHGRAFRLFTTNRWVTGEVWYGAEHVIRLLDRFEIDLARPSWVLNRWLTAVLRLFRPQIIDLIAARDARITEHRIMHPERNVFEDRSLHVTSDMLIDVVTQIRAIETVLFGKG